MGRISASPVMLRPATVADDAAVWRLAQLDSSAVPTGPVLIAEVGGRPLAAPGVLDGRAIADPFERTAELIDLLRLRASHLSDQRPPDGSAPPLRRRLLHGLELADGDGLRRGVRGAPNARATAGGPAGSARPDRSARRRRLGSTARSGAATGSRSRCTR